MREEMTHINEETKSAYCPAGNVRNLI